MLLVDFYAPILKYLATTQQVFCVGSKGEPATTNMADALKYQFSLSVYI